jgi:DNA invertase Pin-like site-specific DNA recombinase
MIIKAIAYARTSSFANVGADKDSAVRQRVAIDAYAKAAGFKIVAQYEDAGVSGADPIDQRPGLTAALAHINANGVRAMIVETASRFARDIMVQEVGYSRLRELGVDLIAADSPQAFLDNGPTAKLIRQVLGAIAEFDKASLVAKLRGARQRKRAKGLKVEGRKSLAEARPGTVLLAKKLAAYDSFTGTRRSLRKVASALADAGHLTSAGTAYGAAAVKRMLEA